MQDAEAETVVKMVVGESIPELFFLVEVRLLSVVGELLIWDIDVLQRRPQLVLALKPMSPSCSRCSRRWVWRRSSCGGSERARRLSWHFECSGSHELTSVCDVKL